MTLSRGKRGQLTAGSYTSSFLRIFPPLNIQRPEVVVRPRCHAVLSMRLPSRSIQDRISVLSSGRASAMTTGRMAVSIVRGLSTIDLNPDGCSCSAPTKRAQGASSQSCMAFFSFAQQVARVNAHMILEAIDEITSLFWKGFFQLRQQTCAAFQTLLPTFHRQCLLLQVTHACYAAGLRK